MNTIFGIHGLLQLLQFWWEESIPVLQHVRTKCGSKASSARSAHARLFLPYPASSGQATQSNCLERCVVQCRAVHLPPTNISLTWWTVGRPKMCNTVSNIWGILDIFHIYHNLELNNTNMKIHKKMQKKEKTKRNWTLTRSNQKWYTPKVEDCIIGKPLKITDYSQMPRVSVYRMFGCWPANLYPIMPLLYSSRVLTKSPDFGQLVEWANWKFLLLTVLWDIQW